VAHAACDGFGGGINAESIGVIPIINSRYTQILEQGVPPHKKSMDSLTRVTKNHDLLGILANNNFI